MVHPFSWTTVVYDWYGLVSGVRLPGYDDPTENMGLPTVISGVEFRSRVGAIHRS